MRAPEAGREGSEEEKFVVLFKEKIPIPEDQWILVESLDHTRLEWKISETGIIETRLQRVHNVYGDYGWHYKNGESGFRKDLPGIYNISKINFDLLLQKRDYNYLTIDRKSVV